MNFWYRRELRFVAQVCRPTTMLPVVQPPPSHAAIESPPGGLGGLSFSQMLASVSSENRIAVESLIYEQRREMRMRWLSWLTVLGTWTASPIAFGIVLIYALSWFLFSPETLEWHGFATLATWCMTLFIQRAEHRDTQAIHAKLDELLHAHGEARNEITKLDEKEPEQIEQFRDRHTSND